MKRLFAICLAALLLAGCRGAGQTTDPFFGRATVEPPHTGLAAGNRPPAYYSGAPSGTTAPPITPRQPVVGTQPSYPAPTARPSYVAAPALTSSPSTVPPNQRLLPGSSWGPMAPPPVSVPSQPSPWSTSQGYALQPPPAASVPPPTTAPPTAIGPTTAPSLAPVGTQPQPSALPAGPTLRPAASIPAPAMQGQCYPAYPCYPVYPCYPANAACDPNSSLAGRQRIVRPLEARRSTPCPTGAAPVPCVPLYNPYRPGTSAGGAINLTDLPEPKEKT